MDKFKEEKLTRILACPICHTKFNKGNSNTFVCEICNLEYHTLSNSPVLIDPENPLSNIREGSPRMSTFMNKIRNVIPERLWTLRSKKVLKNALKKIDPGDPQKIAVNLGTAPSRALKKNLHPYLEDLIKVGIPHFGKVDAYTDAHQLSILNDSIDMFISISVLEHLSNPEKAVSEIARILQPGGLVYLEVPFMRSYHMAPIDYQRYTISGLEELFKRHGIKKIDIGISSGPFTAWVLFFSDFILVLAPRGFKFLVRFLLSFLLHPLKYLDRLCENASWANHHACNFYFLGEK